jgi:hypothetical protein
LLIPQSNQSCASQRFGRNSVCLGQIKETDRRASLLLVFQVLCGQLFRHRVPAPPAWCDLSISLPPRIRADDPQRVQTAPKSRRIPRLIMLFGM